jgi:beta-lactamase class A
VTRRREAKDAMTDTTQTLRSPRRARVRSAGRHLGPRSYSFRRSFAALGGIAYEGAQVSATVLDLSTASPLVSIDDRIVLPTASVGKVLLLIEVSARLTRRAGDALGILEKAPVANVGDSGILRYLRAPALPIADLATLVGATSDNLATNMLIGEVGLDAVRRRGESLGLHRTALLDIVRDSRGPDDAPQLSIGSTAELAWLMGALARGEIVDAETSRRVMGWLSLGSDLSMVASSFGLDPLAHASSDHGILLINKTGTDAGVRSEVGALRGPSGAVSYAVSIQFDDTSLDARLRVLEAMRTIGADILDLVA